MSSPKLPPPLAVLLSVELPSPVKAAAGLAVQAYQDARALPNRISELPMALVTALMQRSLQAQQQYTELVTKGEQLINTLRGPSEEVPEWATFDEDLPDIAADAATTTPERAARTTTKDGAGRAKKRTAGTAKERTASTAKKHAPARPRPKGAATAQVSEPAPAARPGARGEPFNRVRPAGIGPGSAFDQQPLADLPIARRRTRRPKQTGSRAKTAPVEGFKDMTLPQIRARAKSYDAATLSALIDYEKAGGNREPVLRILDTRLASLKPQG